METIKIEAVNNILENLDSYNLEKKFTKVIVDQPSNYFDEKYEGGESQKTTIYKLGIDDLHLKVIQQTDSYGSNESVVSLRIVKPVLTQVTNFI